MPGRQTSEGKCLSFDQSLDQIINQSLGLYGLGSINPRRSAKQTDRQTIARRFSATTKTRQTARDLPRPRVYSLTSAVKQGRNYGRFGCSYIGAVSGARRMAMGCVILWVGLGSVGSSNW